jgi:Second Messenger Oligonucleotide or Dinucleotide Synthetase domain
MVCSDNLLLSTLMPVTSVNEAFAELLQRIELNTSRVTLASQRYNAVKSTIERNLIGKVVRQIGSFQRKTKIRPTDLSDRLDMDALVSFGPFFAYATPGKGVTPDFALTTVRNALSSNEIYRVMPQQQEHPVVRLEYADQMSIELVPAFEDHTGNRLHRMGEAACYIVGTPLGIWKPADYDFDADLISSLNKIAKGKLIPTIKLVKAYFRGRGVPLCSFHSEILVANVVPAIVTTWEAKHYTFGYHHLLAGFLSRAATIVTRPVALQDSFSPPVDSDLSESTLSQISTFLAKRAEVAWQLCKNTVTQDSISGWREFFGEPFPD